MRSRTPADRSCCRLSSNREPPATTEGRSCQPSVEQFADHSWSAVVNVKVEPDGWSGAIRSAKHSTVSSCPRWAALLAGQYAEHRAPFLIDFSIRAASIPKVSYVDVLRGDPATLDKLKDKKVIVGGTALELGDRFSVPNGAIVSGPVLQSWRRNRSLQGRVLRCMDVAACRPRAVALLMFLTWRRLPPARGLSGRNRGRRRNGRLLQAGLPLILDTALIHIAIAAYLAAMALDEIDFRGLLGRIAESRFQRIAMSLGDGLVCADANPDHGVESRRRVDLRLSAREMIGRPLDTICANRQARRRCPLREAGRPARSCPGAR